MPEKIEVKTAELIGPALDWAVAHATKAWEWAYEWFPTMTLDPTFLGVSDNAPGGHVNLVPRNPMRQGSEPFKPSTDWAQGGRLMDKHCKGFGMLQDGTDSKWRSFAYNPDSFMQRMSSGETILIAFSRALVALTLGDTVQIPAELAMERCHVSH